MLRPFDFVLDDVLAELRCEPVQLVAVGFVYDDVARRRVAVPHDLVSGDRLAAFGDFELGFCRRFLFRGGFARGGGVVAVFLLLFVDEQRPEFEDFAFGVDLQDFFEVVEVDDPRPDLAVQFLLVVTLVDGYYFAQNAAAELDIERLHLFIEHVHTPLDVVLPLALEETLDRLLGFGRSYDLQPFGLGTRIVGRDDLDLVATVDLRGDRFELVVDLGADGTVADLRVDVVGEIQRRGAERHLTGFSFRRKYYYFRSI